MAMPSSQAKTLEIGPASDFLVEAFERDGFAFPLASSGMPSTMNGTGPADACRPQGGGAMLD